MVRKIPLSIGIWMMVLLEIVTAVGVMPANQPFEFDPESLYEGQILVMNTAGEMRVKLETAGELAAYIKLEATELKLLEGTSQVVKYHIDFPKDAEPRVYRGQIRVTEMPEFPEGKANYIAAAASVVSGVEIFLQPVENYVVADEYNIKADGDSVEFKIPVRNMGFLQANDVSAKITVNNEQGEEIDVLETNTVTLLPSGKRELVKSWESTMPPGIYTATFAITVGEEEKAPVTKEFFFKPEEIVAVKEIRVPEEFMLGGIIKYTVVLQSQIGKRVEGAFVEMEVYDEANNLVSKTETPPRDLAAFEEVSEELFFDTAQREKGSYRVVVKVHQSGMVHEVEMKTTLRSRSMKNKVITGMAVSGRQGNITPLGWLLIAGIIMIVNIVWIILWKKRKKEKMQGEERSL